MFYKNGKNFNKIFFSFSLLLFFNLFFRFLNIDAESSDYKVFLSKWVASYRELPLKECFSTKIGNYSPPYNYFLILFSRINFSDLYLIKMFSMIFEFLGAYFITDLIAYISKKSFNILIFVLVMFIPVFLIDSSVLGQCDAIYCFFSFMAIYFAIKNKSKASFICFGLSVCFKFLAIVLFPVALVLLLCRDKDGNHILKWKDLYLAPLVYVLFTGISMLFGKSFNDAFLIYFEQSVTYNNLSSHCLNLAFLFNFLTKYSVIKIVIMLLLLFLTLFVLFWVLMKFIKLKKLDELQILYLSFIVTFIIVLLMPKMHDRYFYLSNMFSICLLFLSNKKYLLYVFFVNIMVSTVSLVDFTSYYGLSEYVLLGYSVSFLSGVSALIHCLCGLYLILSLKKNELISKV